MSHHSAMSICFNASAGQPRRRTEPDSRFRGKDGVFQHTPGGVASSKPDEHFQDCFRHPRNNTAIGTG